MGGQQPMGQQPLQKGAIAGPLPPASPGPMLKHVQGGPPGPSFVGQTPDGIIKGEDETKRQPEGGDEGSDELPCTINTFGFGSGHNDQLLKALAENGHGMYAYIESTDQIPNTFAECLGGLV